MSGLNRVAFNNFIEKAMSNKKYEFSEKYAGNIGPGEEKILKEILTRGKSATLNLKKDILIRDEEKRSSNFVTLDDIEKILR